MAEPSYRESRPTTTIIWITSSTIGAPTQSTATLELHFPSRTFYTTSATGPCISQFRYRVISAKEPFTANQRTWLTKVKINNSDVKKM